MLELPKSNEDRMRLIYPNPEYPRDKKERQESEEEDIEGTEDFE